MYVYLELLFFKTKNLLSTMAQEVEIIHVEIAYRKILHKNPVKESCKKSFASQMVSTFHKYLLSLSGLPLKVNI